MVHIDSAPTPFMATDVSQILYYAIIEFPQAVLEIILILEVSRTYKKHGI